MKKVKDQKRLPDAAQGDASRPARPQRRKAMRSVLGISACMLGAGVLPGALAQSNSPGPGIRKVDVHAHYLPEQYREALLAAGHAKPSGMPGVPKWSVEQAISMMDRSGIEASLISVSAPGIYFGDAGAARKLARSVNEDGAKAVSMHPNRFGLFASLPLPDVDGALREIEHAFDNLKADGVVMCTNHGGVYLGDPRFDLVFAELDRRNARIFIHPNDPHCVCCQQEGKASGESKDSNENKFLPPIGYPYPMIEFMFETTRAVFNMILSGTLDKYPNLKIIVPHAGATIPVLADRVAGALPALGLAKPINREYVFKLLRGLYYDMAGFPIPRQLGALLQIADPKHIMYGSDWPFTPEPLAASLARLIDNTPLLTADMRNDFLRHNALALFPRLQKT